MSTRSKMLTVELLVPTTESTINEISFTNNLKLAMIKNILAEHSESETFLLNLIVITS